MKSKQLKARLGDFRDLPDIKTSQSSLLRDVDAMFLRMQAKLECRKQDAAKRFKARHKSLVSKQKRERDRLKTHQNKRMESQDLIRAARFQSGIGALWDHLRGEHKRIQRQNQSEAYGQACHDRAESDALVFAHLKQRQRIEMFKLRHNAEAQRMTHALEQDHTRFIPQQPER